MAEDSFCLNFGDHQNFEKILELHGKGMFSYLPGMVGWAS